MSSAYILFYRLLPSTVIIWLRWKFDSLFNPLDVLGRRASGLRTGE